MHILRLRSFVKPYLPQIFFSVLNLAALTALGLYVPRIIRDVIDEGLALHKAGFLLRSALLLLALGLAAAALAAIQRFVSEWIGAHVGYDLRNRLYEHIQNLSFSYHDHATIEQIDPALLRPLLIPLTSKKWTAYTGIGGRHPPDSVDGMHRNHWPPCSGIRSLPVKCG